MGKSLNPHNAIIPGVYDALWSAYFIEIIFDNGRKSGKIEMNQGVRGINCKVKVEVGSDGYVREI